MTRAELRAQARDIIAKAAREDPHPGMREVVERAIMWGYKRGLSEERNTAEPSIHAAEAGR